MLAILKNRLFPIKPLPLFKQLRFFQFGREVAEEYLWFRNVCNPFNVLIVWYSAAEVESRTQGSRPRTQKKSEAKDSLSEDRHSLGQGQECSRPRPRTKDTSARVLSKKKRKIFTKIFQAISKKKEKGLHKNFSSDLHKETFSKKFFKRSTKF